MMRLLTNEYDNARLSLVALLFTFTVSCYGMSAVPLVFVYLEWGIEFVKFMTGA